MCVCVCVTYSIHIHRVRETQRISFTRRTSKIREIPDLIMGVFVGRYAKKMFDAAVFTLKQRSFEGLKFNAGFENK